MHKTVSVVLRDGTNCNINLTAEDLEGLDPRSAMTLIGDLFEKADIDSPTRTGKILVVDQILLLAQEQRADAWSQPTPELRRFLAAALCTMQRENLTLNLKDHKI